MLDQVDAFFSLLERFKKYYRAYRPISREATLADRFIRLFEKHSIQRNQIPRYFGHGITLEDVNNSDKLIAKLNHEILQSACDLFAVRLEWLEGADDKLYEVHHFYKQPAAYRDFLSQLVAANPQQIYAKLVLSVDKTWTEDALLILEEQIKLSGDEPISRYHLCGGWVHKYWKCRAELTSCIAMTLNLNVPIKQQRTPVKIDGFCQGKGFVYDLCSLPLAFKRTRFGRRFYQDWHPDQWVFDPDSFISDIADGDFGKANALARWLEYFDEGLLETGYHRSHARAEFAAELEKLKV